MKNNLEPIPTPKELLWREFRVSYMPWIVMALAIGITWLVWTRVAISPTLMGEVEIVRSQITSPEVGIVQQVLAQRFDIVKAGDPLIVLKPTDIGNEVSRLRLELDTLTAHSDTSSQITLQRAWADYYSLRLDLIAKKVDLEQSKAELTRAENDLVRSAELVKNNYLSKELYDVSLASRDSALATVTELSALLPGLEKNVDTLRTQIEQEGIATSSTNVNAKLDALEQRIASLSSGDNPVILTSPIDGMISGVWCAPGEAVTDGYVMMMVNATTATRIVGYMRQPFPVTPVPGMPAKIVTHASVHRVLADTVVESVGHFMEPITNGLARLGTDQIVDMGLPVSFKVPEGIELRPGETVGLMLSTGVR